MMSRSASASPLRKKPRLSSPTYDADFVDLDPDDLQALDDIEAKLSQEDKPLRKQTEEDFDLQFVISEASLPLDFASEVILKPDLVVPGVAPFVFGRASGKAWMLPSATALEAAKVKFQVWEAEIETELSSPGQVVAENSQPGPDRVPLKVVENSVAPPSLAMTSKFSPVSTNTDSHTNPPRPFKAPAYISNPVLARSSAATSVSKPESLLRTSSSSTPSTPLRPSEYSQPPFNSPSLSMSPKPTSITSSQTFGSTPQKAKPLGLTPRAHAFTGSKARPRFVTPFKQGMAPREQRRDALLLTPKTEPQNQPQHSDKEKSREVVHPPGKITDGNTSNHAFDLSKPKKRETLLNCGRTPQSSTKDEFARMGFDIELFGLTSVSHFLYYRFNPAGADAPENGRFLTQASLGADTALRELLASGCRLATKAWVDNHWSLILWKLIGMSCLNPTTLASKWCWAEVMRQLRYRYARELMSSARPALRLITTQDAPASAPMVLCVSDVFWTDEYVDADGQLVPSHPELELSDGWYRLRATVDETLARATRRRIIRVGRKIACSGARLESSKKDPMEVLDAYGSMHLILSGNSTHLAQWHAKLGFQSTPFVATLGSLSSDGGCVSVTDLLVTQVYPVAFLEFITTETGEQVREGPRTEKDEAQEEDKWKERRTHEAMKLQDELETKLRRLESYADRLERIAGSAFQPTDDESLPDSIEGLVEELEDSEDPTSLMKPLSKIDAGLLSQSLKKKCEAEREKAGEEIDRELATSFPPRQVRNFRVLRVQDARAVRKASTRTAQLTVWDVMSLNLTEGSSAGSFAVGQRYMVTNLLPSQPSAWMGLEPGSEVFLSTRRDSKWKIIR